MLSILLVEANVDELVPLERDEDDDDEEDE
jgi:hypothetical protein